MHLLFIILTSGLAHICCSSEHVQRQDVQVLKVMVGSLARAQRDLAISGFDQTYF